MLNDVKNGNPLTFRQWKIYCALFLNLAPFWYPDQYKQHNLNEGECIKEKSTWWLLVRSRYVMIETCDYRR